MEDSFLCYLFDRVYSYFDWRVSSDSSSRILASSVRRWAVFGLIPSDSCFFYPKGGPCSDSFPRILASSVRRCSDFGLNSSELSLSCPKGGRIRTHSLEILLLLSEGAPTSDSSSRILASSVRRCSDFGLNSSDSSFSCPKPIYFPFISEIYCFTTSNT